ncbi:hypothetical protein RUM44_008456 [Polyplax serrata]|uniref:Uncharacterized protein n=1 Tax=Polyplax serrata TaxID=468196 RepID=A0ABR1BCC4_POLSC
MATYIALTSIKSQKSTSDRKESLGQEKEDSNIYLPSGQEPTVLNPSDQNGRKIKECSHYQQVARAKYIRLIAFAAWACEGVERSKPGWRPIDKGGASDDIQVPPGNLITYDRRNSNRNQSPLLRFARTHRGST